MVFYRFFICVLLLDHLSMNGSEQGENKENIYFLPWIDKMNHFEEVHNALHSIIIDHPDDIVKNYKILFSLGILIELQGVCDIDLAQLHKDNNLNYAIFELFGKGLSINCDCQDYFNKHLSHSFSEKKNDIVKDYFYNRFQDYYCIALQNKYIDNLMNEYKDFLDDNSSK